MDQACHPSSEQLKAFAKALGDALKRAREDKHWSVYRLSKESGLDQRGIRRIEEGKTSPSAETLLRLAIPLEVRLSAIIENSESQAHL